MEPKKALTLAADLWGPVVPLWIEFVPTHWVNTFGCYVIANWCKMRPSLATSLIRRVKIKMEVKDTQSISDHSLPLQSECMRVLEGGMESHTLQTSDTKQ